MSVSLTANNMSFPLTGGLDSYTQVINSCPVLSAEEERELATKLTQNNDLQAARKLILSHLRFVFYIARGYSGYGLPQADLIQEGNVGLMKAVKRFNPEVGVRLVSFAVHWIRAEIHEYILKNWRIVKVATTKAQRKLFFNLRSAKKRLGWFDQKEVEKVAADLGVSPIVVRQMEERMSASDAAFDGYPDDGDSDSGASHAIAPMQYLKDQNSDPALSLESQNWEEHTNGKLMVALSKLDERSQDILKERWLAEKKMTLHELSVRYQVSAERIRQLEKNAMKKVRLAMEA